MVKIEREKEKDKGARQDSKDVACKVKSFEMTACFRVKSGVEFKIKFKLHEIRGHSLCRLSGFKVALEVFFFIYFTHCFFLFSSACH